MKVFISHSWKNKTTAQKIADELKTAGIQVWMDANELLPGQNIQQTIDEVINKMDIVVLVWSKEASASDGVMAEIYTCSTLNKMIIPCLIDETSLQVHLYLKQIKGIIFKDFTNGIGRLKMVLVNYMNKDMDMLGMDNVELMNDFMATLETTNHLVQIENIKESDREEDKDYWIEKVNKTHDAFYEKGRNQEAKLKEINEFLLIKMDELQNGMNNEKKINSILQELNAYKYANDPFLINFIGHVQNMSNSFKKTVRIDPIDKYRSEMEIKLEETIPQIKQSLGLLSTLLFPSIYDNLKYYYLESANLLQSLEGLCKRNEVQPVVHECVNFLIEYIKTPAGVVDNTQFGIFGYADDAYFIYALADGLAKGGEITVNIDWVKVNDGSTHSFNFLGIHVKENLDNYVTNYVKQLNAIYYPHAVQNTQQQYIYEQQQILAKQRSDIFEAKLANVMGSLYSS